MLGGKGLKTRTAPAGASVNIGLKQWQDKKERRGPVGDFIVFFFGWLTFGGDSSKIPVCFNDEDFILILLQIEVALRP